MKVGGGARGTKASWSNHHFLWPYWKGLKLPQQGSVCHTEASFMKRNLARIIGERQKARNTITCVFGVCHS